MNPVICNPNTSPVANSCHDGDWILPVDSLAGIAPDRNHVYILPDDSVWVLSHDGTRMIALTTSGTELQTLISKEM